MPRAVKTKSEEIDNEPKRAPRRRVTTSRKPRKALTTSEEKEESTAQVADSAPKTAKRKAPTRLSESKHEDTMVGAVTLDSSSKRSLYVSGSLLALALILAVTIGYSDAGQINTAAVITERNTKVASGEAVAGGEEGGDNQVIPVQNTASALPNGGLVSSGGVVEPATLVPPADTATSTASTTDEMASSTEEVATSTDSTEVEVSEAPSDTDTAEPPVAETIETSPE